MPVTLLENLVERIRACQKGRLYIEMGLLKTVYGEIQLKASTAKKELTDEDVIKVFKKFKAGVKESIAGLEKLGREVPHGMIEEIELYDEYIPDTMPVDAIKIYLEAAMIDELKACRSVGQATGLAMKHLKGEGMPVEGKNVSAAVGQLM